MFGIFRTDEGLDEVDVVRLSDQPFSNDCENTFYQRSACDLCRTQQQECQGSDDTCDRCVVTSSACTYTLSSGKGPGKKRLRKIAMAHPGLRTTRSAYQSRRNSISTSTRSSPVCRQKSMPDSHDTTASSNRSDSLNMFADTAWDFLIDDPFAPGALAPLQDTVDAGDPGRQDSRRGSAGALPPLNLCPSRPQSASNRPPTSQDTAPLTTASVTGASCSCPRTMLELLEMIGARVGALKGDEMEDLFICLGCATDRCRALVQCPGCMVLASNPVMVATLGRQLLALTQEIVGRLQTARQIYNNVAMVPSPLPLPQPAPATPITPLSSVPAATPASPGTTSFQYGRYTVGKRQVHARLLETLVRCHVDEVRELLGELRRSCMQATSAMPISAARLEDAQRLADGLALVVG